jgi:hypothetical protein
LAAASHHGTHERQGGLRALEKHFETYNEYGVVSWRSALAKAPTPKKDTLTILQNLVEAFDQGRATDKPQQAAKDKDKQRGQQTAQGKRGQQGHGQHKRSQGNEPDTE